MSVAKHYDSIADNYHRQYQRENLTVSEAYPANYFRLQILIRRLIEAGAKSVYEVGVGEGTPLAAIARAGMRVAGCDIAESMVEKAKQRFKEEGLDPDLITWGDLQDSLTISPQLKDGQFDAVIAAGVLPHVANDSLALANMAMIIRPGGKMFVEFRNKLFSLFTMNRYTKDFILDDLLAGVDGEVKTKVAAELDKRLAVDLPPVRAYDKILSKFHNPFELTELVERSGFMDAQIHWYHYHPAPPMLAGALGPAFREAAMGLEHDPSWRGLFLCSAGVIEATKI